MLTFLCRKCTLSNNIIPLPDLTTVELSVDTPNVVVPCTTITNMQFFSARTGILSNNGAVFGGLTIGLPPGTSVILPSYAVTKMFPSPYLAPPRAVFATLVSDSVAAFTRSSILTLPLENIYSTLQCKPEELVIPPPGDYIYIPPPDTNISGVTNYNF